MAPTKKKQGESKKKKDVDPEEQHRQDLLLMAMSLRGEKERENSLEGQFRMQSESLKGYWEIEKKERDERRQALLGKEHRLEGIKDRHIIDLGANKQTIKQLLFANQVELSGKTSGLFIDHQSLSDMHHNEIGQLYNGLHDISNRMAETTRSYERLKTSMCGGCNDEVTALREEASLKISNLAAYYESQFKRTREDSTKRLMGETMELSRQNDDAIKHVMEKNEQEIKQMRTSCGITMNENLDKIATLRREVVLLREQDRHDRRLLSVLRDRNNDIVVPLKSKTGELHKLQSDLVDFHKQKRDLDAQIEDLRGADDELKEAEWDHEVLFQKLQALEIDRDAWKKKAQQSIHSAQQSSNFQNLMLERKLSKITLRGERDTAAIAEVLRKANIDLDTLDKSHVCVVDVINEKKSQEELLRQRLKHIQDAHKAMLDRHRTLMEGAAPKSPISYMDNNISKE
ncbi:hypothetical protein ACHAW5_006503 [Stephanodiscus triporus]|uniref:Growth arrest-specific protein 8 domain-containing protein n=1 Tax=Stephanodiscus triporus TaxID=2934178 RepID=A0ABD3NK66_9STRA